MLLQWMSKLEIISMPVLARIVHLKVRLMKILSPSLLSPCKVENYEDMHLMKARHDETVYLLEE